MKHAARGNTSGKPVMKEENKVGRRENLHHEYGSGRASEKTISEEKNNR